MTTEPGRVALIAGGSRGIGAATSRLLASRGMRVVVNYRSSVEDAEEVVASIHARDGEAMAVRADVDDPPQVHALVEAVATRWGAIDVMVNTALIPYAIKSFQEMSWEEFGGKIHDEMLAAFELTKAVTPAMVDKRYGRIVHVATDLARHPRAGMMALGSAKAALVQFTRYVAQELGPYGITVNVVSPGPVDTRIGASRSRELEDRIVASTPLRRIARPEDVAETIAFFAGDGSGFLTGTCTPVNGGLAMD
ncbi:SDR family oxidoreductase [Actinoallomurus sp. NBC_01490]|jgi:3-oxoacyl-[acyl-carrier protein] reductase|uniref:SDR family NAD(P)-dependent oxidoreductase n=1 Tax=Actinoallomurus sp. NBC_01490 TaxID=2903557 RepID=UPI002E310E8D|nr:SDR family oxidoreductase [Actinoallomurus sp. NBC_01490]